MINVIVGFTAEKLGKPSEESEVEGRVRLCGGVELPSPFAAFAGKIWTAPSPDISSRRAPKSHVPVVPLKVPVNVVAAPTGEVPAVVTTPAPLTQYEGGDWRHGFPDSTNERVSAWVSVPVNANEVPVVLLPATVRPAGRLIVAANIDAPTDRPTKNNLRTIFRYLPKAAARLPELRYHGVYR
jgi:hypothetical protein